MAMAMELLTIIKMENELTYQAIHSVSYLSSKLFYNIIMVNAVAGKDYRYDGAVPLKIETHGGDDVGIFASGPWAHLFSGVMNQNTIPHLMAYAACIGDGLTNCS